MRNFKNYCLALNPDEDKKFKEVKTYYKKGQKQIFMGMLNAMHSKIPVIPTEIKTNVEETE